MNSRSFFLLRNLMVPGTNGTITAGTEQAGTQREKTQEKRGRRAANVWTETAKEKRKA